ncbi:hypothetical protein GCM10028777_37580 [Angustibacter speluncae]
MLAGCSLLGGRDPDGQDPDPPPQEDPVPEVPAGPSWAPAPQTVDGLSVVARSGPEGFALHTRDGDVGFLPGVNLGSTTPGHQPGELAITADDYRRWFAAMGELGVRVVRVYTIHPPAFYDELAAYNTAHEDAPLYLVQGVYLPDESYVEETKTLYDETVTTKMQDEVRAAVGAVHGDLERAEQRGRAEGTWSTDVSAWTAAWLVGVEWDPRSVLRTDRVEAARPGHDGRFFASTPDATATERWIAARLDETAVALAEHGTSVPVALVSWPTVDPLEHPDEPLEEEDLVGVDANHVLPTAAWPGGSFASYHAYPYYPDFQRHEPALQAYRRPDGQADPYEAYLLALQAHHAQAGLPLMVTETGVPSSLGSAHAGSLGRDQGGHSEAEAMQVDADLLRALRRIGLAGGLLFSWSDEWFKFTWNTIEHQVPADRRQLWHDALTNEQHFGLHAQDATGPEQRPQELLAEPRDGVRSVTATYDESYLHLVVELDDVPTGPVVLGLDARPDVTGPPAPGGADGDADWSWTLDPETATGQAWVREEVDPVRLDSSDVAALRPPAQDGWVPFRLMTNRPLTVPSTGERLPAEFHDTGVLRAGPTAPDQDGYDSRNVWRVEGSTLTVRVPWAMAGLSDPSSRQALVVDAAGASSVDVDDLGLSVRVGTDRAVVLDRFAWEPWNRVYATERAKDGIEVVGEAMRETAAP